MNKKAFELAISTIILLVIGVAVLIAIILAVTGGFDRFKTTISPLLETAEGSAIRQSCQLACQENNRFNFCCTSREINNEEIKCSDSRLEINCNFNCDNFQCASQNLDFSLEYSGYSWPSTYFKINIMDKKILLEINRDAGLITRSKMLTEQEWFELTTFFTSGGILDVKQENLIRCQPPNCPVDGGGATLKIMSGSRGTILNTGSSIISQPQSVDNVLDKLLEITREMENR